MKEVADVFLMFLSLLGYSQDQDSVISNECSSEPLVHPFLGQLREKTIQRYVAGFDIEDVEGYMANIHEDVHIEIYFKDQV